MGDVGPISISKGTVERIKSWLENAIVVRIISTIFLLIILIFVMKTDRWGDLYHYYNNASDVLHGLMPYSETQFEYPPLSLVFMLIPCALSWDLNSFFIFYAILACLFFFIGVRYIYKISDRFCDGTWQPVASIFCLIFFGTYFLIARNDIFPATIVLIGLWMYLNKRYVPAFVLIAVATMTKLYPGIFVLAMVFPLVLNHEWKTCGKSLLFFAAICFLVELPFLIKDPSTAFAYLSYHSERGIQIESVVGSIFLVYQMIFPSDISVIYAYGCDALSGVGPDSIAPWMNIILFVSLIVFIVVMFVRCRHLNPSSNDVLYISTLMVLALLLLFIMFSKVYSAQYIIWIALVIPITQISYFDRVQRISIFKAYILLGIFSFLSYVTYIPWGLVNFNTVPVLLTVLKNVFFVVLLCVVLRYCWMNTSTTFLKLIN